MELLRINHRLHQLFCVAASVFLIYSILLILNVVSNAFIVSSIVDRIKMDELTGLLFGFHILCIQHYFIGYMLIIYVIYFRMKLIRKFLEKLGNERERLSVEQMITNLKSVMIFIDRIGDTIESVKFGYTINAVAYVAYFSFFTILTVHGFLSYFFQPNSTDLDLVYSILSSCWEIYYSPVFIWIFFFANQLRKECMKIQVSTQKLFFKTHQQELKVHKIAEFFLMQLHHRLPIISCGVFSIYWNFLFYLIATFFSYLIIIIQFEFQ